MADVAKDRFNVTWVSQRATLIIFNVTDADDKRNGEFSCELSTFDGLWSRKIQVEVLGKPDTPYNCKTFTPGHVFPISIHRRFLSVLLEFCSPIAINVGLKGALGVRNYGL